MMAQAYNRKTPMILTALLSITAPLSFPQHGQDYVLRDTTDLSSDVITIREDPNSGTPIGFATLEMTLVEEGEGNYDLLLMRMDDHNNVLWKRQFGGPHDEFSQNIIQTQDAGIVACAFSHSTPVGMGAVLVKFDATGHLMWTRCFPGDQWLGFETGVAVTELANGNLVLLSGVRGLLLPDAIDGVQIITDPNGIALHTWRHDATGSNNLPTRISYNSSISRGNETVACGTIIHDASASGGPLEVNTFIQRLPVSLPGSPLAWFNEYQISPLPDWATGIEWAADETLVISGAQSAWFAPPSEGFSLRVKDTDGFPIGSAVLYDDLVLTDVVEEINPVTDPTEGPLCFSGYLMREPDLFGIIGYDAVLMKTDPLGMPVRNYLYDPTPWGVLVSVTPYYQSTGYATDGYFALGTSFSNDYVAPTHQHWVNTDPDLKAGCLEELYDQPVSAADIAPLHVSYTTFAMDGMIEIAWFPFDPDLEVVDICEEDDGSIVATCFGDGAGTPCPCGNSGGPGEGCANSTGLGAILAGTGTPSVSADTLVLSVTQGKPGQPILFFQGINFINSGNGNPFGDGLRCCGGGVKRLQARNMDATGSTSTTVTLSVKGGVAAGSTYCNQGWYRDPSGAGGSPCSTFFNLTNGLSVTWAP
jgi:hypothetical protein